MLLFNSRFWTLPYERQCHCSHAVAAMPLVNLEPWLSRQYVCIPRHLREKKTVTKTTVYHLCPPRKAISLPTPAVCDYDGWKWMVPFVHMAWHGIPSTQHFPPLPSHAGPSTPSWHIPRTPVGESSLQVSLSNDKPEESTSSTHAVLTPCTKRKFDDT